MLIEQTELAMSHVALGSRSLTTAIIISDDRAGSSHRWVATPLSFAPEPATARPTTANRGFLLDLALRARAVDGRQAGRLVRCWVDATMDRGGGPRFFSFVTS